jgi:regulator of protease activity HflC (stomatin/prohibitin superfamily)
MSNLMLTRGESPPQIDEILKDALQADCTKYAPGIEIFSVRVTKPRLPPAIEANYEAMEAERTRVGVARERALVVTQEAETEHRRAVMIVKTLHLLSG